MPYPLAAFGALGEGQKPEGPAVTRGRIAANIAKLPELKVINLSMTSWRRRPTSNGFPHFL
jgi:hypothetical protein